MATKSSLGGSAAASEICVYIQDDNHDKENIKDQNNIEKISSKESISLKELEETSQEKKCITKPLYLGKMGNVARWNYDLILHLIDNHEACHAFGTFFYRTASKLSQTSLAF